MQESITFDRFISISVIRAMKMILLSNEAQRQALLTDAAAPDVQLIYISHPQDFAKHPDADVYMDLSFEYTKERIELLSKLQGLVIINSVAHTLQETHNSFVRINGWTPALSGEWIEASGTKKEETEKIFAAFHKKIEWLPDQPGFVAPRVIAMIINEAFHAREEGVSTTEAINTAMKLGTNYPYGPFEWAGKIGLKNIKALLQELAKKDRKYTPSPSLLAQPD